MNREDCDGGCYESDEEYGEPDEEEPDSDVVSGEPGGPASQPDLTGNIEQNGGPLSEAVVPDASVNTTTQTTTPPRPNPRPQNLDGGSSRYWENQDLDFGDEPTDDIQDRSWTCQHFFSTYKISLATALTKDTSTTEIECVKCWCNIRPEIEVSNRPQNANETMVPASAGSRGRGILRPRGRARARYIPPGRLLRADAAVERISRPTTTRSRLSQSVPARELSPMEDVQYTDRVVDTYGNIIATTELEAPRRASLDYPPNSVGPSGQASGKKPLDRFEFTFNAPSDVLATKFSLAHECRYCRLLVCEPCKDATKAAQEASRRDSEADDEGLSL